MHGANMKIVLYMFMTKGGFLLVCVAHKIFDACTSLISYRMSVNDHPVETGDFCLSYNL